MEISANIVSNPLGSFLKLVCSLEISQVKYFSSQLLTFPDEGLAWGDHTISADPEEVHPIRSVIYAANTPSLLVALVALVALFFQFENLGGRRFSFQLDLGILDPVGNLEALVFILISNLESCLILSNCFIFSNLILNNLIMTSVCDSLPWY